MKKLTNKQIEEMFNDPVQHNLRPHLNPESCPTLVAIQLLQSEPEVFLI